MLDFLLVFGYVALPMLAWWLTQSLTWVVVRVVLGFGLLGAGVQTLIAFGMAWNQTGLEIAILALFLVITGSALRAKSERSPSFRSQVALILVPSVAIALFLIGLRLLATNAGPLTAVGYLFNHPLAEDNAKWLNLTAQLAANDNLSFSGYAGGPLLVIMALMATGIAALSTLMFGGVNEVAVAANAVVGSQFLLLALVPFAFAPFAERRIPSAPVIRGVTTQRPPAPALWVAMFVVFIASAVVTSYGHLSLQYVMNLLVLWSVVFLVGARTPRARLLVTLTIATAAAAWFPLNVLGLAILFVGLVVFGYRRAWVSLGLVALTLVLTWNSLVSSALYALGINLGTSAAEEDAAIQTGDVASVAILEQTTANSLLASPGGTEIIQPLLVGLALVSFFAAAMLFVRQRAATGWRFALPFAPIGAMVLYVLLVTVADAIVTAASPNYGVHKMAFVVVIMILASTLPVALLSLDRALPGMTVLRWFAVGGVVLVLSVDTILPRGLSALSPKLWPGVNTFQPRYWSAAEVRSIPEQRLVDQPFACVIAPPLTSMPTGLPRGQENYSCSRLLSGLTGLESQAQSVRSWLEADWLSNEPQWERRYEELVRTSSQVRSRLVVLTDADGEIVGLTTFGDLLDRYRP